MLLGLKVGDPAHHQPTRHLIPSRFAVKCGERDLGDLGPGDPLVEPIAATPTRGAWDPGCHGTFADLYPARGSPSRSLQPT